MLKKIALPIVALAVMLGVTSAPAKAAVRFGVTIGAPVYTYPAYPAYPAPVPAPAPYVAPVAPGYYYTPAPVYPSVGFGFGWGGHRDHDRGHEFREHEGHERGGFRR